MKKIYLVDVSSMFFRAFYAIRPLTTPKGVPVNAVYGFLSMTLKLLKDEKPDYLAFCYDRKEPSFRKELYEDYKANRTEMPEDLGVQIPIIKNLIDLLGIPALEKETFEADDIIGSLAVRAREQGLHAVIVSGDKDFAQLVGPGVELYDTMKEIRYDAAAVKEKWGVEPDQMIDYLAIVGDTSDNIPGVAGIGPKGAVKLLQEYRTLDNIYANIESIESKSVREKLLNSKDQAFLAKRLVTISTDVEVPVFERLQRGDGDKAKLRELLQELNFKSFEKAIFAEDAAKASAEVGARAVTQVAIKNFAPGAADTPHSVSVVSSEVLTSKDIAFQELTPQELASRLKPEHDVRAWPHGDRIMFLLDGGLYGVIRDPEKIGPLLSEKNLRWSGFHLKDLWHQAGIQNPQPVWDSMLAAYVLRAQDASDFRQIAESYLRLALPETLTPGEHADVLVRLEETLKTELRAREGAWEIYEKFDLPLAPILYAMETRGILLDREQLRLQSAELVEEIAKLEKQIHEMAGEDFNIGSPKQLGAILFQKLGLPTAKKTKTGYSTDTKVLTQLDHPIASLILSWREMTKLKSTYLDALPEQCDAEGRVHTEFTQATTATGRLSSINPNLQNIPIRRERGQRIRRAFIATPGKRLLSVDYSQIELRILAHISDDPGLQRAFAEDRDIHATTASEIFGIALDKVDAEHRRVAKAVNFGIAYGQGVFGLAETLKIPRSEAQEIIATYFKQFKGVKDYIENTTKIAMEQGYVETLFGRRRYMDELKSKNPAMRKFGERAAINAPIQGTASDIVRLAMIQLHQNVPVPMLLQVHDELIFEDTEENLQKWRGEIVKVMEGAAKLKVPLKVNHAVGQNWDEAH